MQSVVDRTGVPADTIRSWERRHGFPTPARDAQNQRLYSEHDIQAIQRLKERTAQGISVREALRLLPDVARSSHRSDPPMEQADRADVPHDLAPLALSPLVDRLIDALLKFDGAEARTLLHTEMATMSPESVAFGSILPAIDRLTLENDAGGAFGREFLRRILMSLFNASDPDNGRDRVVIARVAVVAKGAGSGDSLLALAHALAVSRMGFAAVWLGADGNIPDIQRVISRLDPLAVLLVADDPRDTETAERWWELLDELPSIQEWSGGRLIASPRRRPLSGTLASERPLWLPPEADAARVLLESDVFGNRDPIRIVSTQ